MLGTQFNQKFRPQDYEILTAIDADKRSLSLAVDNGEGKIFQCRIPAKPDQLINTMKNRFANKKIAFAYEAGPTGYALHDALTHAGYRCLVLSPASIAVPRNQRVKTNRLDALQILESLRGGRLQSIHVPSLVYRDLRHLTQLRSVFAYDHIAAKTRIKSLLNFESIALQSPRWDNNTFIELDSLNLRPIVRFKVDKLIEHIRYSSTQLKSVMKEIRRLCQCEPELKDNIRFIMSVSGLGWITSSHLLARIGDPSQLERASQISAFVGLVACESSTGDKVRRGRITRLGEPKLRSHLVQAAWNSIRKDPELRAFYERIYKRHPLHQAPKKAIVAVANKLCRRVFAVLKTQRPYVKRPLVPERTLTLGSTRPLKERRPLV